MRSLVDAAATALVAAAIIAGAVTLSSTRLLKLSIGVFTGLLLAAGLLRLALPPTPVRLPAAAALVSIRKIIALRWGWRPQPAANGSHERKSTDGARVAQQVSG